MNTEDQQLIQECLAGRTESFGKLVVRYQDRLFNSLCHIAGSHDEARPGAKHGTGNDAPQIETLLCNASGYKGSSRRADALARRGSELHRANRG